jgi:hypothetical protein
MTKKWEYMIVKDPPMEENLNEEKLNELGDEGWELVSVTVVLESNMVYRYALRHAYLKREKKE